MMCRRCKTDIAWPDSLPIEERNALLRLSYESRIQAYVHLIKAHGFSMLEAKKIASHLAVSPSACCRHGCSGRMSGAIAACPKCGSVTLGENAE